MNRAIPFCAWTAAIGIVLSLQGGGDASQANAQEIGDNDVQENMVEIGFPNVIKIPVRTIAQRIERQVERMAPVERLVLGMRWKGSAHCQGEVSCSLNSNPNIAELTICIMGSVISKTTGKHGPACIESVATTSFVVHKQVFFDGELFTSDPAAAIAKTNLEITKISSRQGGTKGSIVCSVATKKVNEGLPDAELIANIMTTNELCQQIDNELDAEVRLLNDSIDHQFGGLRKVIRQNVGVKARSYLEFVEIAFTPQAVKSSTHSQPVHLTNLGVEQIPFTPHP